jgi:hypothetical protein
MPKKSNSNAPKFTIDDLPKASGKVATLTIPRVSVDDLGDTIEKLIKKARDQNVEIKIVKGTLTCY